MLTKARGWSERFKEESMRQGKQVAPQKLEGPGNKLFPRSFRRQQPCRRLDFGPGKLTNVRDCKRINESCLKPLSL